MASGLQTISREIWKIASNYLVFFKEWKFENRQQLPCFFKEYLNIWLQGHELGEIWKIASDYLVFCKKILNIWSHRKTPNRRFGRVPVVPGPWNIACGEYRFGGLFDFFFAKRWKKISDRTTLPRETPKDRSRKHPGKVTKQKSETRLRFRRALSRNFKRRFEKVTLL